MKQIVKSVLCIFTFLIITTASLPVNPFNFRASDADFTHVTVVEYAPYSNHTAVYVTGAKTVEDFFRETGIDLHEKDVCDHFPKNTVRNGMVIQIFRGMDVHIGIDGRWERRRLSPGTTLGYLQTALQLERDIPLVFLGEPGTAVHDGDYLWFSTWQSEFITVSEAITFDTLEHETSAVRSGTSHVRQEGVAGEQEVTTAVVRIGGQESQRDVFDVTVINEPVNQIIDVGTGGRLGSKTDTSAPDFHYIDKFVMNASAYTAGFGCTGKHPSDLGYGITATGRRVQPGIVAVDPEIIPLGTFLYVEGYGFALAADVGGAIKGYKIDLYHEELEDALRFGRRNIVVYILG